MHLAFNEIDQIVLVMVCSAGMCHTNHRYSLITHDDKILPSLPSHKYNLPSLLNSFHNLCNYELTSRAEHSTQVPKSNFWFV